MNNLNVSLGSSLTVMAALGVERGVLVLKLASSSLTRSTFHYSYLQISGTAYRGIGNGIVNFFNLFQIIK